MKKLLITKRLTALVWTLVLALMPMSLMADNTPLPVSVGEHYGGFVLKELAPTAFDGDYKTKWCSSIPAQWDINPYVEVQLTTRSKLDYYYLYTGNDIHYKDENGVQQQRNPKEWKLYAKVNEGDKWTLISHVTDAGLPTTLSTRSNNYKIDAEYRNIEYNYLKFEFLQVEQGTIFEVGEICLINCNHEYVDGFCTECGYKEPLRLSFTIDESLGGFSSEGPDKAIDGITTNKWCADFSKGNPYIVLKNDGKAKLDHYHLYTGNDIVNSGNNRNPKEWKLYAKEKASDEWTVISHVTDAQLPTENSAQSNYYTIPKDFQKNYYKFFKFEIMSVEKGDIYEVGELCLMGYPCQHQYDGESAICSICGDMKEHEHIFNDELKCTGCGLQVSADCIIEYTATERLSAIYDGFEDEEGEVKFDYTDKVPGHDELENFGEDFFGVPAIKHEYDEATGKGRIICNAPVTQFIYYTKIRRELLTSITLPSTVTEVDTKAFEDCSNLTSITFLAEYSGELPYILSIDYCNKLQEIIVPYNSYAGYVAECQRYSYTYFYIDENDKEHKGYIKDLLKSLLPLDDTEAFETPDSKVKADATLQRSFANDGWYSLCLPFSISVADSPFSQVAEFSEIEGDTYRFTTVDNIEAGKAYIVKVDAAVANPTFKNVFIDTKAPASDGDFIGVYSPTVLGEGCKVIGTGTTVNPVNPGKMKGFRAYFPASAAGAKAMRFTVDDGEATDIQSLTEAEGYKLKAKGAYNLAGQKVNENYRGIVVRNGKKVLVK